MQRRRVVRRVYSVDAAVAGSADSAFLRGRRRLDLGSANCPFHVETLHLMPVPVCLSLLHRLMPVIMLVLFAMPTFGIATVVTRVTTSIETTGGSSGSQTESLEERVPCSTSRREEAQQLLRFNAWPLTRWNGAPKSIRLTTVLRAVVGHRLSNGSMAPIRC